MSTQNVVPAEPGWVVVTAYSGGSESSGDPNGPDWEVDADVAGVEIMPVVAWSLEHPGLPYVVLPDIEGDIGRHPWHPMVRQLIPDDLSGDCFVVGVFHPAYNPMPEETGPAGLSGLTTRAKEVAGEIIRREELDELRALTRRGD